MPITTMTGSHLKTKSDIHLARKLWHVLGVLCIAIIYSKVPRSSGIQLMALTTALFVVGDLLRHQVPALNKILIGVFNPVLRESERNQMAGSTYLLLGCFFTMFFFPKPIVVLCLLLLAVGDPVASYVGIRHGRDKILGEKTLQGAMGAFVACSLVSAIYFFTFNLMTERLLIVSLIAGLVGALSELLPMGKLDDNFSFPVFCGFGLWVLFYLFGGL